MAAMKEHYFVKIYHDANFVIKIEELKEETIIDVGYIGIPSENEDGKFMLNVFIILCQSGNIYFHYSELDKTERIERDFHGTFIPKMKCLSQKMSVDPKGDTLLMVSEDNKVYSTVFIPGNQELRLTPLNLKFSVISVYQQDKIDFALSMDSQNNLVLLSINDWKNPKIHGLVKDTQPHFDAKLAPLVKDGNKKSEYQPIFCIYYDNIINVFSLKDKMLMFHEQKRFGSKVKKIEPDLNKTAFIKLENEDESKYEAERRDYCSDKDACSDWDDRKKEDDPFHDTFTFYSKSDHTPPYKIEAENLPDEPGSKIEINLKDETRTIMLKDKIKDVLGFDLYDVKYKKIGVISFLLT